MSETPNSKPENTEAEKAEAPKPEASEGAAPQGEGPEPGPEQLKAMIAALQETLKQENEQKLRLLADMDNLRKRMEREKEETAKFAITKFARDLIGVTDNFERAITSVPAGSSDPALESLLEGVGMIDRELKGVLERHGVKRIWPEGEIFNPHYHQPMMETQNPDVPPGTILQVFQAGYMIDERVLRAAMVVVAKGGAKPQNNKAASDGDSRGETSENT